MAASNIIWTTTASGMCAVLFYLFVTYTMPPKLPIFGKINKWFTICVMMFFIGFFKHEISYYLTVESNYYSDNWSRFIDVDYPQINRNAMNGYCKQTGICNELYHNTSLDGSVMNMLQKAKTAAGLVESVWVEAIGEGVLFVIIGIPFYWGIRSHIASVFLTGMVAHLIAEYTGFHQYFCKKSCDAIPFKIHAKLTTGNSGHSQ